MFTPINQERSRMEAMEMLRLINTTCIRKMQIC
nr:hypothetical protein Iba_chr14eCG2700 [Ipomoea batatas]